MESKIIIRILSGARKGQTETMPLAPNAHITLGRAPGNTVAFDRDADGTVSRDHAVIQVDEKASTFTIVDSGSTYGTSVNGLKITGPTQINLGDKVSLGPQTSIIFDVEPRPEGYIAATKKVAILDPVGPKTTKIDLAGYDAARSGQSAPSPRATTEKSTTLSPSPAGKRSGGKYAAAAAVLIAAAAFGGYYYVTHPHQNPISPYHPSDAALTTQQIADNYSKATVFVGVKWRLYDKQTGKPVYQKRMMIKDTPVALYVSLKDKGVVPWLTTDDDNGVNIPIGFEGSGSGFLETPEGLILTNKHVAAGWKVKYSDLPEVGYVVFPDQAMEDVVATLTKDHVFKPAESKAAEQLEGWVPADGGVLFESDKSTIIGTPDREFEGRDEDLFVQFPGSNQRHVATLENFAPDADVASIRISPAATPYPTMMLSDEDTVKLGQNIVVIGYPGISQQIINAKKVVTEAGNIHTDISYIREPTVTDGVIANLGMSGQAVTEGQNIGTMGDAYQLTVLATGHGNSGGPVLDVKGHVVGIFTYSQTNADAERVTYAVPIKYARQLLGH